MSTRMTDREWALVALVFESVLAPQGPKADNVKFLRALHFFAVHSISWRAMPSEFGHWNSLWRRFDRLSRAGVFEDFFEALASLSDTAHLVQMFDSTVVRAHVSAAGAKGGKTAKRLAVQRADSQPKSI